MSDDEHTRRRAAVLTMLPETVRAAVLGRDLGGLKSALAELDPREAGLVIEQLRQVGILAGTPQREEATSLLEEFAPLLRDIVAVARGDQQRRGVVEQVLAGLQEAGYQLADPVERIWNGERDVASLTSDLEDEEAVLVRDVLVQLGSG